MALALARRPVASACTVAQPRLATLACLELTEFTFKATVARALATVADAIVIAVLVASAHLAPNSRIQLGARAFALQARSNPTAVHGTTRGNGAVWAGVALQALALAGLDTLSPCGATTVTRAREQRTRLASVPFRTVANPIHALALATAVILTRP